jgi:hypothetical protein
MTYPLWSYFPANERAPQWVDGVVAAVGGAQALISTEAQRTGLSSDAVLRHLAPALQDQGFAIEQGKTRMGKIARPVLFGENGLSTVNYEVDGFHEGQGIVLEVEAGRGARGNADYRDLLRTSLILDAEYLVLMLPIAYRFRASQREGVELAYRKTRELLQAVYASQRLRFPFRGILLVGY